MTGQGACWCVKVQSAAASTVESFHGCDAQVAGF